MGQTHCACVPAICAAATYLQRPKTFDRFRTRSPLDLQPLRAFSWHGGGTCSFAAFELVRKACQGSTTAGSRAKSVGDDSLAGHPTECQPSAHWTHQAASRFPVYRQSPPLLARWP